MKKSRVSKYNYMQKELEEKVRMVYGLLCKVDEREYQGASYMVRTP
jgi:hypothetical protein